VLGLIFENINGYKDGSFFTPGFISIYMTRETVRQATVEKFNDFDSGAGAETRLISSLHPDKPKKYRNIDEMCIMPLERIFRKRKPTKNNSMTAGHTIIAVNSKPCPTSTLILKPATRSSVATPWTTT
jgi:hypothetical protein